MLAIFRADEAPAENPSVLTVGDVVGLYLKRSPQKNPRVLSDRKRVLGLFADKFGGMPLADAKRFHLRFWIDGQESWQSNWTRASSANMVKAAFGWAVREDLIAVNPFSGVNYPKGERGRPLGPGEYQAMLRASRPHFRRCLVFLRFTGCRPGEMSSAEWPDVDARRCCITLWEHKTAERTGLPRQIILHPVVVKLLAWIQRNRPHPRLIFVNRLRRHWAKSSICREIKRIRAKTNIADDTTCYMLRHGFAVEAILNGVDIAVLKPLMGHKRIETTAYYADIAGRTDHLQAAVRDIFRKKS